MNNTRLTYRIALSLLPGIDTDLAGLMIDTTGAEQAIFEATEAELKAINGMTDRIASAQSRYQALEQARAEVDYLASTKIQAHWFRDDAYPHKLLHSTTAPLIVYTIGSCDTTSRPVVSIVGTRHATPYGISFTERLVRDLAVAIPDIIIVSGLAYGIDIAAHKAALAAGVTTIGVVAHGLATLYPAQHRDIARRMIANGGAILTEYKHDIRALRGNFLSRNRLVALLGDALVVAESAEQGGALSTARHARKAARSVFALPGRITDNYSIGCIKLISDGMARPITSADDIITHLGWEKEESNDNNVSAADHLLSSLTPDEKKILNILSVDPDADNDLLATISSMPVYKIMTLMTGLEMKGLVVSTAGNRYQIMIPLNML